MSTIRVGQEIARFIKITPICGNCTAEKREKHPEMDTTTRSCTKHGWLVLMSSTCKDHQFKPYDRRKP